MNMIAITLIRKSVATLASLGLVVGTSLSLIGCEEPSPPPPPPPQESIDEPLEEDFDEAERDRQPDWNRDEEHRDDRLRNEPLRREDPLREESWEDDPMRDDPLRDDPEEPDRRTGLDRRD